MTDTRTAEVANRDDQDDPFERHCRRDPLPGAAATIVVVSREDPERARAVAAGLAELLRARDRAAVLRLAPVVPPGGVGAAIEQAVTEATTPLVLITTASVPWSTDHLDPLLAAIDKSDHVIGGRRLPMVGQLLRWLAALPWKLLFAIPVQDIHSPCQLHRRESIATIPLQSTSGFVDVEILAKATFLGHLIAEAPVPPLASSRLRSAWRDLRLVFRKPIFVRPPAPPGDDTADLD